MQPQAAAPQYPRSETMSQDKRLNHRAFLKNAKVQLNPGSSYGTGGAGHMRMNLGTSRKLVQLALDNMARAMSSI